MFEFKIEGMTKLQAGLKAAPTAVDEFGRAYTVKVTATIKSSVYGNAPKKSGNLRSSIHGVSSGFTGHIYVDRGQAPYADIVMGGSSAHSIYPSTKLALYWAGATHPSKMVRHPGTKPNDFMGKGEAEALPEVEALGVAMLNEIIKVIKG